MHLCVTISSLFSNLKQRAWKSNMSSHCIMRSSRFPLNNVSLKMLAPFITMILALSSCSSPGTTPNSFLSTSSTAITFIQWTDNNGQLSGQLQTIYVSSVNSLQTQQENDAFT